MTPSTTRPSAIKHQASRRQVLRCLGAAGVAAVLGPRPWAQADARRDVPTPPELTQALPQARLQGSSRFRYYGFHVYDAQLWVPPTFEAAKLFSQPFALCLIYARSLKARDIAERSIEEMRRQTTLSEAEAQRWLQAMTAAFADVRNGDRLTGLYQPDGSASFFLNGQATQVINDKRCATLFFGIWLSSATSAPALRRDLLGV
ncbi:chalcone isomerase family protein [Aquabacterium sp.]|uniref:chalcone isomerase family protein n=1 Tax=Aquabacterium sp. TaxID=1872578 RepID=UPI0019A7A203|nr:chalcone isomerase family protein [Aquabacterium sp.]MBC7699280.1 chalcone isomerase family protein [Aquabacterium sp.]